MKVGGRATWWNNNTTEDDIFNIPNLGWQSLIVSPTTNGYFNETTYYLPQKQF